MNILSLCDGISCGQVALKRLGIDFSNINYYASEIAPYSIQITQKNHPKTIQIGRCRKLSPLEYERLQTLPDGYTEGVANSKRYCGCGDGWTVDVIKFILEGIKDKLEVK